MIKYRNEEFQFITMNWSWGKDCKNPEELEIGRSLHWAYLTITTQEEADYFLSEHIDEGKGFYWRHYEFLAVPCAYCGVHSPLRAQFTLGMLLPNYPVDGYEIYKPEYIDYHPYEEWPEEILTTNEQGWYYRFFRDTLSDSKFGQETFTVSPKELEL